MDERVYIWIERWIGFSIFGLRIGWWRYCIPYRTAYVKGQITQVKSRLLKDAKLTNEQIDGQHYRWWCCGPGWKNDPTSV